MNKKLKVLKKIADLFNENKISWAVGASLMLYLNNITDKFNDIDIMVDEKDIIKVENIMDSIAKKYPKNPNEKYKTRYFFEYMIDSVDIDIMAGFVIVKDSKQYDCSFDQSQIEKYVEIDKTLIPLHSLLLWRRYYNLMGRENKVSMIDSFLDVK